MQLAIILLEFIFAIGIIWSYRTTLWSRILLFHISGWMMWASVTVWKRPWSCLLQSRVFYIQDLVWRMRPTT